MICEFLHIEVVCQDSTFHKCGGFTVGMHTDNCSPRDALLSDLLSLASGSCLLVPGACCGEPHLTMCSIILGNFSSLWNLLKSHFSMLSRQDSLLSCIGRTCLCISLKDGLETTERAKQQDSGRGKKKKDCYIYSVPTWRQVTFREIKGGRCSQAAFCKLREEYKLENANVCSDVRLLKPVFNLCNSSLMTCGAEFPVSERITNFPFFYLSLLPLSLKMEQPAEQNPPTLFLLPVSVGPNCWNLR